MHNCKISVSIWSEEKEMDEKYEFFCELNIIPRVGEYFATDYWKTYTNGFISKKTEVVDIIYYPNYVQIEVES
jgi:hypothetical protein